MPLGQTDPSLPGATWRWRALAAFLILTTAGLRLAWLAHDCPLDLAPDEAHYWDWSRHLDWSYYSKGPLVACLIHAGTSLAGPWAEHVTGNAMLAVRLPAVLCGCLFLVGLYVLTVQVLRQERLAALLVALMLTMPTTAVMSAVMTIDAPYICCWCWALVLGYHAVFATGVEHRASRTENRVSPSFDPRSSILDPRSAWVWLLLGLVIGLGILAKYTMVVFIPSLALFLLTSPEHRRLLVRPGFWIMTTTAGLCCLPILIWNVEHDWVTFKHVNGLAGLNQQAERVHWLGPLVYLGTQFALLLGSWFVAWLLALIAFNPWRETDAGLCYLWWLSAPMFVLFLAFSFKTGGGEPNWPVTAYVSGMVLTTAWLVRQLQAPGWRRRAVGVSLAMTCVLGLTLCVLLHCSHVAHPILADLGERVYPGRAMILRRFDPTCRLRGWRTLAGEVDRLRNELRSEGTEPVLAGTGWSLPGELGFYCAERPTVYSVGVAAGDRHSQYDFWHPNPVDDPAIFLGRTFIIVGSFCPELRRAFDKTDEVSVVTHYVGEQPVNAWQVVVCRGFKGFASLPKTTGH